MAFPSPVALGFIFTHGFFLSSWDWTESAGLGRGWGGAEMRVVSHSHRGLGTREGGTLKSSPGVWRLSHTYFKANPRSVI